MRQIKFRFVWQIGNTIIKQDLTIDEITAGVVTPKIGGKKAELVHKLQFTGLTDKNGVEIYEGDILNMWYAPRATCKGVVIFNNGSFKFATKQAAPPECHLGDIESLGNYIEVIGNTHQNPELLEK